MNRSDTKLVIAVDFDGTLALGTKSHITLSEPNYTLINRLKEIKKTLNPYIKIVTARGAKNKLTTEEKISKYKPLIERFCLMYEVPYDEISFAKEYADMYIDDMTIGQYENFIGSKSLFTNNSIIFTENTVIKKCNTALFEKEWYQAAKGIVNVPEVLFINDESIILQKIKSNQPSTITDIITLLENFKVNKIKNFPFFTYTNNIKLHNHASEKVLKAISSLKEHEGTFFHGDLCLNHIIKNDTNLYLIDPNYKNIFGSYLTDAGKAFFSLVAFNKDYTDAEKIIDKFGKDVISFAVAEGLRVCKYRESYISIVNNIAELN